MRFGWAVLAVVLGCAGPAGSGPQGPQGPEREAAAESEEEANPLLTDATAADFHDNPPLLSRLLSGPHGYFRFINILFNQEVCRRLGDELERGQQVNLHGDPHLEQYAVTDLGRGLTDFDDATRGPAVLDLIRFGVSVRLIAGSYGWGDKVPRLIERFFDGYRDALKEPDMRPPVPEVAARFLRSFKEDHEAALRAAEDKMDPLDIPRQELQAALDSYGKLQRATNAKLAPGFFDIIKAGRLRIGIGSALTLKYLIRVEGPSDSPDDDVVLEAKRVQDLGSVPCLNTTWTKDPFRILVSSARIAYQPFRYLGYTRLNEQPYWVHAWVDNYFQVTGGESFNSASELEELVYDAGVQLGRGHPNMVATPLDAQLRAALLDYLSRNRAKLVSTTGEMAALTVNAWRRFSARITTSPGPPAPEPDSP